MASTSVSSGTTIPAGKPSKGGRVLRWLGIIIGIVLLLGAGFWLASSDVLNGVIPGTSATPQQGNFVLPSDGSANDAFPASDTGLTQISMATAADGSTLPTTVIRSASESVGTVGAAGNLALVSEEEAILRVGGTVESVNVRVGDVVQAGDLLATLESGDLEDSVQTALLDLNVAQLTLDDLLAGASQSEIATAQANLLTAQQSLSDLQAGPSAASVASAQASLAAAQAKVNDLQAGPTQDKLTQLSANLRKSELTLADAQRAYDQVSWRADIGASSQASELQSATIDYESTLAAYNESVAPASDADLQSAYSSVSSAQESLSDLLTPATDAEIAAAQAQVTSAQAALDDVLAGPGAIDTQSAQLNVEKARIALASAASNLSRAEVRAPIAGTILTVGMTRGQQISNGATAFTLADTNQLELTVNVAEVDVKNVATGMAAEVTIDALPGRTFAGVVTEIAPSASASSSVVNYPVTIQLTGDLSGARPGMTAVASLQVPAAVGGWLVPASAIRSSDGATQVLVMRDGVPTAVNVTLGDLSGEWQVVQSPDLNLGDEVVGSVTSQINDAQGFGLPGGGMMMGAPQQRTVVGRP